MINENNFGYEPPEHEAEKASNSYLMSVVAVIGGLPLPIINLLATFIFFMGNRKGGYFVRWHCTHALLSQFFLFVINCCSVWWTFNIIFLSATFSNEYFGYILTVVIFNIAELIATIYTAIKTRKGIHVEWWFFGSLTNLVCKP